MMVFYVVFNAPGKSKMASEMEMLKDENDPLKSKYVMHKSKGTRKNNCIEKSSAFKSCKLSLKFLGLCHICMSYKY